jgi:hypothetical protein
MKKRTGKKRRTDVEGIGAVLWDSCGEGLHEASCAPQLLEVSQVTPLNQMPD